jgi:hypothetical protein
MRGRSPHGIRALLAVTAIFAATAFVLLPVASAGNPEVQHFTFGPFVNTDVNFCGTGKTVIDTFTAHLTVWNDPNQAVDSRNQSVGDDVFTSPSTGLTVVSHSAYSFTDTLISGDPNGLNTHEWTFKGAAQIVRVAGSGVLTRDAGFLVVHTTWSGPEFNSDLISVQIVSDAGGHPNFLGDFCALMVPALGLV